MTIPDALLACLCLGLAIRAHLTKRDNALLSTQRDADVADRDAADEECEAALRVVHRMIAEEEREQANEKRPN